MDSERESKKVRFEVTWSSVFKALIGVLIAFAAIKLWPVVELLVVSVLVAVVLYRIVQWCLAREWPRWVGILLATAALLIFTVGLLGLLIPMAVREGSKLAASWPKIQEQALSHLPKEGPVGHLVDGATKSGASIDYQKLLSRGMVMVGTTAGGVIDAVVVFALIIYMLIDGPRAIDWWVAFFPRQKRPKIHKGLEEIGERIVAYVSGQLIVSACFATYSSILLTILGVPMAILLGLIAGLVDILPIIGILIALVPASLMALTVSPTKALLVVAGYLAYHGLEDYLIVPKVYGNKLRISTLAVLVSMLVGGVLAGVIGAITALPLVAAYPCLERLWFAKQVEPEVLKEHADLRAA